MRQRPVVIARAGWLILVLILVASRSRSATPNAGLERFYTQKLAWSNCGTVFECTSLAVPLDYANPAGRTIQLAVIRAPATGRAHRIGSLITIPETRAGQASISSGRAIPPGPVSRHSSARGCEPTSTSWASTPMG